MERFRLMLAPIEDMTSNAFRSICYKYGADLTFTELIRVAGLAKEDKNTWARIKAYDETPTSIQLLGAKEVDFLKFLSKFNPSKGFKGFNLNLGCPNPRVVELGQGCALIRRITKVKKIIDIFKDHSYKASIKMRLGLNKQDKENKVYLNLIEAVDADFFIVHARYGSQSYNEPADFSIYKQCAKTGRTIIANGDITTIKQIKELREIGVKGAMIGRAAVLDPSIFNKLKGIKSPSIEEIKNEFISLTEKYDEPFRYRKNVLKRIGGKEFLGAGLS
jgi:tRNA-dihydrouridine synthase B